MAGSSMKSSAASSPREFHPEEPVAARPSPYRRGRRSSIVTVTMPIRAVLFDWGGTLVHQPATPPETAYAAVAKYARQKLFLALRDQVFELAFTEAVRELDAADACPALDLLVNAAFERLGWSLDGDDIAECSRRFFTEATAKDTVFDDARALLASLKYRGYRTGVATNSIYPGSMYTSLLADLGLTGHLDCFVTSADTGRPKPAPDTCIRALEAIGGDPHETLFVGDTLETDIVGARAAGMRAILLDRAGRHHEGAGYLVVERLSALNELLGEGTAV